MHEISPNLQKYKAFSWQIIFLQRCYYAPGSLFVRSDFVGGGLFKEGLVQRHSDLGEGIKRTFRCIFGTIHDLDLG